MNLLIIEDSLKGYKSHHFQYISDICRGAEAEGWTVRILGPKDADASIAAALPFSAVLTPLQDPAFKEPRAWKRAFKRIAGLLGGNIRLSLEVAKAVRKFGVVQDLALGATCRVENTFGFWLTLKIASKNIRKLALIFPGVVGDYAEGISTLRFSRKLLPFAWMIRLFRRSSKEGRASLLVESSAMRDMYQQFTGLPFEQIEHVVSFPEAVVRSLRNRSKVSATGLHFGCFGPSRYDKGLDVLQNALRILQNSSAPPFHCTFQWHESYSLPDGTVVSPDSRVTNHPTVTHLLEYGGGSFYFDCLGSIDLMVLPYRKSFYHAKLSRVAIDAAVAGIPFIYPKGTWLEAFAEKYEIGLPFIPEDSKSLAEAMVASIEKFDFLKTRSLRAASSVEEAHSVKAFLRDLLGR